MQQMLYIVCMGFMYVLHRMCYGCQKLLPENTVGLFCTPNVPVY